MTKAFLTSFILICYAILVGCGTKGSLYIPEQRYPQKAQEEVLVVPDTIPTEQLTKD